MIELNTRDLIVLTVITKWNTEQAKRLQGQPVASRPSLAIPCTITLLCGKKEPGNGLVNKFIQDQKLGVEMADDSEQVYRSTRKLAEAGLIYPPSTSKQQFAQTEMGNNLVKNLSGDPKHWPAYVKVDGKTFTWPAGLTA